MSNELATEEKEAFKRINAVNRSPIPIVCATDETKILADNWNDLLDGTIKIPLNDVLGLSGSWTWWSGSNADGTYDDVYNCSGWTSTGYGMMGKTDDTTALWIHNIGATGVTSRYVIGIAF